MEKARELGKRFGLALYLYSLARAEMKSADYLRAKKTIEEGRTISIKVDSRVIEGFALYRIGQPALATGDAERARHLASVG